MIHFSDLFHDDFNADLDNDGTNDAFVKDFDPDGDGISHLGLIDTDGGFFYNGFGIDLDGDGNFEITATTDDGVHFDLNDDGINNLSGYDVDGDGVIDYYNIDINGDGLSELELYDVDGDGTIDDYDFHPFNTGAALYDLMTDDGNASFDLPSADEEDPFDPYSYDDTSDETDIFDDVDISDDIDVSNDDNIDIPDNDVPTSDDPHDYLLDTNTIPTTADFTFVAPGTDVNSGVAYDTDVDGVADTYYYDYHGNDGIIDTAAYDLDGDGVPDTIAYDTDGDGRFDLVGYDVDGDNLMDKFAYDEDGDGVFELEGVPANNVPVIDPVVDEPVVDPVVDEPGNDEPVIDPVVDNPEHNEPVIDPVVDKPGNDEPVVDPVVDEPEPNEPNDDPVNDDGSPTLIAELDTDRDGITDMWAYDVDGNGTVDSIDVDNDGDGIVDASMRDTDFDGIADILVVDNDGDGYIDEVYDYREANVNLDQFVKNDIEHGNDEPIPTPAEPTPENPDKPDDDGYQTHEIGRDENMKNMLDGEARDKYYDFVHNRYVGERYFVDTDGDGQNDVMIRHFDSDGNGQYDTSIQYYDVDRDGTVDAIIKTELIDTDGDGVYDTYTESLDTPFDGMFDEVRVYDYDAATGGKELVNIYYDVDSSEYDIDADRFDVSDNFDPDSSDPDAVVGDPSDEMEYWEFQGNTNRCAIYAQKFIIEQYTGQEVDIEELVDKAIEHGWFDEGTGTYEHEGTKLLELYGVPSETNYNCDFEDIRNALENGKHVIVGIDADEIWGQDQDDIFSPADGQNHAVDVIGIDYTDPENPMVILNDSGHPNGQGELVPLDVFMDAWDDSNYRLSVCG